LPPCFWSVLKVGAASEIRSLPGNGAHFGESSVSNPFVYAAGLPGQFWAVPPSAPAVAPPAPAVAPPLPAVAPPEPPDELEPPEPPDELEPPEPPDELEPPEPPEELEPPEPPEELEPPEPPLRPPAPPEPSPVPPEAEPPLPPFLPVPLSSELQLKTVAPTDSENPASSVQVVSLMRKSPFAETAVGASRPQGRMINDDRIGQQGLP
jgi:hypothetical protein